MWYRCRRAAELERSKKWEALSCYAFTTATELTTITHFLCCGMPRTLKSTCIKAASLLWLSFGPLGGFYVTACACCCPEPNPGPHNFPSRPQVDQPGYQLLTQSFKAPVNIELVLTPIGSSIALLPWIDSSL
jgi:hypothetical protein